MINISEQRLQTACLLFIVAVLAAFGAYWLRPVLLPFVVAVFIVSGVSPILEALQRSVASTRLMAAVIAFLAGCLIVATLMAALWASVVDLAENAGAYQARVEQFVVEVEDLFSIDKPKGILKQIGKSNTAPEEKNLVEESSSDENVEGREETDASTEATPSVQGAKEQMAPDTPAKTAEPKEDGDASKTKQAGSSLRLQQTHSRRKNRRSFLFRNGCGSSSATL